MQLFQISRGGLSCYNDWETVTQLFSKPIQLTERDEEGKTLIHFAALYGHADFLQQHLALLRDEWVNAKDEQGATPLYLATRNRHWACVKLLLNAKADLQVPMADGLPLIAHWVSSISDPAVLEDLLSTQTPVVQRACLLSQSNGIGLLHHAAAAGQTQIVRFLISKGEEKAADAHSPHPLQVDAQNPEGYTPLLKAILNGHAETISVLLQHDAKLEQLNINGDNPIHYAMRCGRVDVADLLTQQLLVRLGFDQRPEAPALQRAFTALYAYHHRPTAEAFFARAQKEHEANERQQRLADLLDAEKSGEEIEEETKQNSAEKERAGMQPIELLSDEELDKRFQQHQLGKAREQLFDLLKNLHPTDPLVSLILLALSESYLQQNTYESGPYLQQRAYEDAMSYASSGLMHYQKFIQANFAQHSPQAATLYQNLLAAQQQRIITLYRQLVLALLDRVGDLNLADERTKLHQHREKLKGGLKIDVSSQTIRTVVKENTAFFIKLTQRLWEQTLTLSQKRLPCRYALLSLGSMSKEEMCPYSDLEFALLLEKDTPEIRACFQPMVRLMHLLVIGLGETPMTQAIPCQIPFSATMTGYHFDKGGNTPLYDDFMATPASLAAIQRDGNYGLTITRNVLRATAFVTGDEHLHQTYQQLLKQVLAEKLTTSKRRVFSASMKRQETQALEILEGALPEFSPSSLTDARHNRGLEKLNIKVDLYRLPTQVVDSLSLYYGIPGTTTFEKLKNLAQKKQINPQTELQLTQVLETALKFRVLTHLHYGTEEESVGYQADKEERLSHEAPLYVLTSKEREEILGLYQILLPLESAVREFVASKGKNNPFKQTLLHSQAALAKHPALTHHLEARSYERLFSPEKALGSYRQALQLDPDNIDIHLHYVSYVHALRDRQQRNQTAYEATAVAHTKQLVTYLLTLQSKQLLTPSGFDPFYEALPLAWRSTFRAGLNPDNPIHHRLLERLNRIDSLPQEELQKVHRSAKTTIAAKAEPLFALSKEEAKEASAPKQQSKTAQTVADWTRLSVVLKTQTQPTEDHAILLTHSFSLLGQLINTEIEQVKEYDQEIAKSLTKVTQVLLTPNKAGIRDDAPILAFYRRLPFETRSLFRHAVLQHQEKIAQSREQRSTKQHQVDLDFFTALLKTVNEEPDEAGQRESWQQHKQSWQETLHSLVDDTAPEKNSVCLVSPLLDKSEKQQRTHYPLKPQIREALLDEALEFKANKINGSEHRVVRLKLKQKDGTSKELYCKAYPEMPGMTYLIERLHHRLIGHGTCLSELVKIERPGKPPIPVLISEAVPGPTLHEVLKKGNRPPSRGRQVSGQVVAEKDSQHLQHLDHQAYSDLVLLAILTNPEDGLPTNYIVTPKEAGKAQLTLVSVDHDHALFPPYLLEPATTKPQETKHAENDNEGKEPEEAKRILKPKLQIKTILFCLEGMHETIDAASREALLRLNPAKVLSSVLREAQVQNDYYDQLFDSQTVKAFHEDRSTRTRFFSRKSKNTAENCTIPIPLKEGDAIILYQKLHRLQQFLTEYPQATLLQCLLHTEPRVGMAYARALDDYCDPLERLLRLGEYPVNLQGQMVTSTHAIKSLRIQTQQIGAEHYADLEDLTPAQGLAELDLMTYQQNTLDSIREEVMQGDLKRFLALKAPEHKAIVISGADQRRKGVDWAQLDATQQRALLDALTGIAFTHLNLSSCAALTKKQLVQLLMQSPDCTALNLSGHPSLDELWLLEIAKNARHLKELTIRQAPLVENIRNTAIFRHLNNLDIAGNSALEMVNIRAPQLKLLQAKNCLNLHTLKTTSQQLREVDISGNSALQLAQELAHVDSAYTLNRLKLAGCGQLKASDITLLSVYPALLWAPSKEEIRVKIIALLDQYVGREGWQQLAGEQRRQIMMRSNLLEYDKRYMLTLTSQTLENKKKVVQGLAQRMPEPPVFHPSFSDLQIQTILDISLSRAKDRDDRIRQSARRRLEELSRNASLSPPQVQKLLDATFAVEDGDNDIREASRKVLTALGENASLSTPQFIRILDAVLSAEENGLREAIQETLGAFNQNASLSTLQIQTLLATAFVGVKNNDSDIRRAALTTLKALSQNSSLFASHMQVILSTAFLGVKDDESDIRQVAWEILKVLSQNSFLSVSQAEAFLSAVFSGVKGSDSDLRQATLEIPQVLVPHISTSQIQPILEVTLLGLKNENPDLRKTIQAAFVQRNQKTQFDQSAIYLQLLNKSIRDTDIPTQLGIAFILSVIQKDCSLLEFYLATLQPQRNQASTLTIQPPTWLTLGSIYEQLEAQVIDLHVPDELQASVKAYENATQTALKTVEDCKAAMEAVVAPELKPYQQQFMKTQAALLEQYYVLEQQRIAAFQAHLANQAEALTPEALAAAQTQFAKEQAEAKTAFQSEIQAFYEQAGDQLNGETKLDVSELLQKRRAFLDVQLEQREIQSREQQTLLIQWQQALQDQAHELQGPQEESKAETPTAPATQKALPQTADQITQLQQALQMLQARVDTIDQSNRALQEQSLADQQALQLQRRQLEILLRERQQAQQVMEAIAAIQAQPGLRNFYHCIKVKLGDCFVACKMFASGAIAPPLSTGVTVVTQGISLAGKLLPIPYAALISSGIAEGIQYLAKRDGTQRSKQVSALVGSVIEMDQLAEKIARLLTWRYEMQVQTLTHESAILLAESAVACMMEGLRTKGAIDPQKPIAEQMIQVIYEDDRLVKLPHLFKTKLSTCKGQTDWTASSVLFKPGIALWDKESLTFSFYAQKLHKDPSKKANHELGSKPEKYGYRLGSLQEVTRLDLRKRGDVPADISTAFASSIGLRFMETSIKQRAVRLEMPVLLPPQPVAAASSEPPEEKEQQPHRPPTPRHSRADIRVDQEENDGSGAPAALHKTKKQVRFSDNIHIILLRPRSSQQNDSPSRSRSPSPTST